MMKRVATALLVAGLAMSLCTACSSASGARKSDAAGELIDEQISALRIRQDLRDEFDHGSKGAEHQKYIVLHDTESEADAAAIVEYWDQANRGVAAHFIVDRDGTIVQCVALDRIAHHAGYGDTGHNGLYGVSDESRDDMIGAIYIDDDTADYGMNSHSIGIELSHAEGDGDYPLVQLEALDQLIAYINDYYGFNSRIIDHKAWRTGNSDTSKEFSDYLLNYQSFGAHTR